MFSLEDELDELDIEVGRLRRERESFQRSPGEGRWCGSKTDFIDRLHWFDQKIAGLDRKRAEYFAERIAEAEGFVS